MLAVSLGFLLGWILFSVGVGVLAGSWGRSGIGWFLLALLLSPLLSVLALLVVGRHEDGSGSEGSSVSGSDYLDGKEKRCPDCAEHVKIRARVCKHCGHEWDEEEIRYAVLSEIRVFEGHLYHCANSDEVIVPQGVMCPNCGGEIDDGDHSKAEDYFSYSN